MIKIYGNNNRVEAKKAFTRNYKIIFLIYLIFNQWETKKSLEPPKLYDTRKKVSGSR